MGIQKPGWPRASETIYTPLELIIIDTQDGHLGNDIRYGDGDKMKWSENTIREEVRQTGTGAKKGQKNETLREERRGYRKELQAFKQIPEC